MDLVRNAGKLLFLLPEAFKNHMNLFLSEDNISVPSVTADQMREIDRIAVFEEGPNLYQMMENAGRNLAVTSCQLVQKIKKRSPKIFVLAGTGGNGGGGICAARHMANHGLDVTVIVTDVTSLKEVSAQQLKVMRNSGANLIRFSEIKSSSNPDLILDCVLGYSLNAAPEKNTLDFILWMNEQSVPVISLDIPSGVNATTGESPGHFVKPDVTLTLALPKTGLQKCHFGKLYLADIGIPEKTFRTAGLDYKSPFSGSYIVKLTLHQ